MDLAQSFRAIVDQFGGAHDDYDGIDRVESLRRSPQESTQRSAMPLALVRPQRTEFALVTPQDFADAQHVADRLRAGTPVIVDLRACGRELSKRLTDFCSGLTYALDGTLQFVGEDVMLLAPHNVELSHEALGGLPVRRFFNQV